MTNFTTKARHNLSSWQTEVLERNLNPEWNPNEGYAPISVAFLVFTPAKTEEFLAVFYEEGQHHSVVPFHTSVFDVPAPTLKAA